MLLTGFVLRGEHGGILKDGHGFWDPSLGRLSSAPGYDDLSRTLVINFAAMYDRIIDSRVKSGNE